MNKIAIVGVSFDLPQTKNLSEFGEVLLNGIDTITNLNNNQRNKEDRIDKAYIVDDMKKFDADFFNLTHSEVLNMDPQHRMFLELCWRLLDQYGYLSNTDLLEETGVFSAITSGDYLYKNILSQNKDLPYSTFINNIPDTAATKVAYKFDLKGISLSVNSACSSGLVAMKVAMDNLLTNDIKMALVGGCKFICDSESGYTYKENSIFSKTGKCSPFDIKSDGMVPGNGGVVIALKKYETALQDNDEILAIVNSIAINNDGNNKNGYTSPSVDGQYKVMKKAYEDSDIEIGKVGYIEMHGTGTAIGDAIEFRSTKQAFLANSSTYIGSIKSNYGHLDTISGLLGILKGIWILRNQIIPKQANYTKINPLLSKEEEIFSIAKENISKKIDYVGINSFGIGGTNAHIVLETEPLNTKKCSNLSEDNQKTRFILPVSTKNSRALPTYKDKIVKELSLLGKVDKKRLMRTLIFDKKIYNNLIFIEHDLVLNKTKLIDEGELIKTKGSCEIKNLNEKLSILRKEHQELLQYRKLKTPVEDLYKEKIWIEPAKGYEQDKSKEANSYKNLDKFITIINSYKNIKKEEILQTELRNFEIDSFLLIEMIEEIKEACGIELDFNDFLNSKNTFKELFFEANSKLDVKPNKVTNIKSLYEYSVDKKNMYIFHPAGGTVLGYKKMFSKESTHYNLMLISFPMSYIDVVSYFSLEQLASYYLDQIKAIQNGNNDYVLCGYSFGGNIAFEVARQLENEDFMAQQLILIDSYPMDAYYIHNYKPSSYRNVFEIIKKELEQNSFKIDKEQLEELTRVWEINHLMLKRYKHDIKLNCDTILLECIEKENPEILNKLEMKNVSKTLWQKYLFRKLETYSIIGNHYSIFSNDEIASIVGDTVFRCMDPQNKKFQVENKSKVYS
ncbi:beta-ketoacyl synthase N-terminal-like domain-containing protein [Priestia megaterium]|uniref:beta-ketoacyl synthase N-terminal-like domain-containing protein n=1 Tax=Priestia megaterium TaxID=1404 RepID=UPI001374DC21|nr:beta-ketoacyl synthase N-terminal-like domain-containing protein [Priestia megaterium]UYT88932.1 thioesterase domain-containing protein [Priestia megaterium]